LYVVRETVHKLGGQIEVESVVNQGTVFRVQLPNLKPDRNTPVNSVSGGVEVTL
jgi:signal transduction histidine kinase